MTNFLLSGKKPNIIILGLDIEELYIENEIKLIKLMSVAGLYTDIKKLIESLQDSNLVKKNIINADVIIILPDKNIEISEKDIRKIEMFQIPVVLLKEKNTILPEVITNSNLKYTMMLYDSEKEMGNMLNAYLFKTLSRRDVRFENVNSDRLM